MIARVRRMLNRTLLRRVEGAGFLRARVNAKRVHPANGGAKSLKNFQYSRRTGRPKKCVPGIEIGDSVISCCFREGLRPARAQRNEKRRTGSANMDETPIPDRLVDRDIPGQQRLTGTIDKKFHAFTPQYVALRPIMAETLI